MTDFAVVAWAADGYKLAANVGGGRESQSPVAGKGKEGPDPGEAGEPAAREERLRPERLPAERQGTLHARAPARLLPRPAANLERRDPEGSARDAAAPPGREPEPSRSGRPRHLGDRPRDRAARPRPPA